MKLKRIISGMLLGLLLSLQLPADVALASAPTTPDELLPVANSVVNATGLKFDWSDVTDVHTPVGYKFEIATNPAVNSNGKFSAPIFETNWGELADSEYLASNISPALTSGIYYWHVRAGDVNGAIEGAGSADRSPWTTPQALVVDNEAPVITGVVNGGKYFSEATVSFDQGTGSYVYNNATAVSFSSGTTFTEVGSYVVVVSDGANDVSVAFEVIDPTAPVLESPADANYLKSSDLKKLTWFELGKGGVNTEAALKAMALSDGLEYRVQVGSVNDFSELVIGSDWQVGTSYALTGALAEGQYFWRAQAKDTANTEGPWSETWSFVVDDTAPVIGEMADVRTNIETALNGNSDDYDAQYSWKQISGPEGGVVTFESSINPTTLASANLDGDYVIELIATDKAGNSSAKKINFNWDTTVNAVSNLTVVVGTDFADLHWINPEDKDLASVTIYRSTRADELGTELAVIKDGAEVYKDETVLGGVTYFYTVVTADDLGNNATSKIEVTPEILTVEAPVVVQEESTYVPPVTKKAEPKEVKSNTKEEEKTEDKVEDKNLPAVGIAILVLIALLGAYLLYLQYPEMFSGLMFWKKKKKPTTGLKPKK